VLVSVFVLHRIEEKPLLLYSMLEINLI
jgi:hypothetical protein